MSEPERSLWRGVLAQAFDDAEMTPIGDESESETLEASRARQYLRADTVEESEHLKLVCEYAGIPADRVILWARRRYSAEQAIEEHLECGSRAAAFLAAEAIMTPEKREICSRTPQNDAVPV